MIKYQTYNYFHKYLWLQLIKMYFYCYLKFFYFFILAHAQCESPLLVSATSELQTITTPGFPNSYDK